MAGRPHDLSLNGPQPSSSSHEPPRLSSSYADRPQPSGATHTASRTSPERRTRWFWDAFGGSTNAPRGSHPSENGGRPSSPPVDEELDEVYALLPAFAPSFARMAEGGGGREEREVGGQGPRAARRRAIDEPVPVTGGTGGGGGGGGLGQRFLSMLPFNELLPQFVTGRHSALGGGTDQPADRHLTVLRSLLSRSDPNHERSPDWAIETLLHRYNSEQITWWHSQGHSLQDWAQAVLQEGDGDRAGHSGSLDRWLEHRESGRTEPLMVLLEIDREGRAGGTNHNDDSSILTPDGMRVAVRWVGDPSSRGEAIIEAERVLGPARRRRQRHERFRASLIDDFDTHGSALLKMLRKFTVVEVYGREEIERRRAGADGDSSSSSKRGRDSSDEGRSDQQASSTIGNDKKTDQDQVCSICFEPFLHFDLIRRITLCKHKFHQQCLDKWFERSLSCPLCRKDVREADPSEGGLIDMAARQQDRRTMLSLLVGQRTRQQPAIIDPEARSRAEARMRMRSPPPAAPPPPPTRPRPHANANAAATGEQMWRPPHPHARLDRPMMEGTPGPGTFFSTTFIPHMPYSGRYPQLTPNRPRSPPSPKAPAHRNDRRPVPSRTVQRPQGREEDRIMTRDMNSGQAPFLPLSLDEPDFHTPTNAPVRPSAPPRTEEEDDTNTPSPASQPSASAASAAAAAVHPSAPSPSAVPIPFALQMSDIASAHASRSHSMNDEALPASSSNGGAAGVVGTNGSTNGAGGSPDEDEPEPLPNDTRDEDEGGGREEMSAAKDQLLVLLDMLSDASSVPAVMECLEESYAFLQANLDKLYGPGKSYSRGSSSSAMGSGSGSGGSSGSDAGPCSSQRVAGGELLRALKGQIDKCQRMVTAHVCCR
ncbi:unnamed protein product [Vitrella brassicaformis CCMP3155]|uniref:RING-type domain-containing protein n=2 Tax=Vitrella brassicaformis TaxID=1169539 RepID=A0A0G4F691_VITBC|nr:unnamed protein product [Vitrella brassicaformis CCMP3155]|eukprot:CEM07539.1 unnamed protein product [Vitrella brassicaformis CCMP3155]